MMKSKFAVTYLLLFALAVSPAALFGEKETSSSDGIVPAKAIQTFRPIFPFELFQQGVSGHAKVSFVVNSRGSVVDAKVVEATHEEFGLSALSCISKWKFEPATKKGKPLNARMEMPFTFKNPKEKKG